MLTDLLLWFCVTRERRHANDERTTAVQPRHGTRQRTSAPVTRATTTTTAAAASMYDRRRSSVPTRQQHANDNVSSLPPEVETWSDLDTATPQGRIIKSNDGSVLACDFHDGMFTMLNDNNQCVICLDKYEHNDTVRRSRQCDHIFHSHCILTWLRQSRECPCCRAFFLAVPGRRPTKPNLNQESQDTGERFLIPEEIETRSNQAINGAIVPFPFELRSYSETNSGPNDLASPSFLANQQGPSSRPPTPAVPPTTTTTTTTRTYQILGEIYPDAILCRQDEDDLALHAAVKFGDMELVRNLLDEIHSQQELNRTDSCGRTATDLAALTGQLVIVNMLQDKGGKFLFQNSRSMLAMAHLRSLYFAQYLNLVLEEV